MGRKQQVKINNSISSLIDVTSGVPQGSHLSPILFNLFINDLYKVFSYCNYLLFADNLKIHLTVNSIDDSKKLQNDLISFEKWCHINSLKINVSKCFQITFSKLQNTVFLNYLIDGTRLNIKSHAKDLGITLSSDLTLNEHITLVIKHYVCLVFLNVAAGNSMTLIV